MRLKHLNMIFFCPFKARYQRSSGEGSELRSEEARVQISVGAVLFRICERWIGGWCDWWVGVWWEGEMHDGFCHSFYWKYKKGSLKKLHYRKLFLLIAFYFRDRFCTIFVWIFASWDPVCPNLRGCSQRLPWCLWRCILYWFRLVYGQSNMHSTYRDPSSSKNLGGQ